MDWIPTEWATSSGPLWIAGSLIAILTTVLVMPAAITKLRGARITGQDRHKPGRPEVAEMGGLGLFAGLMAGSVAVVVVSDLTDADAVRVLAAQLVMAGAALVGVLDDLISLAQRFKAALPLAFAIPFALFVQDTTVDLPFLGSTEFSFVYPLLLVPVGIACASNGFNMLEGFNGLGAGIALITSLGLSALAVVKGEYLGLVILLPLAGATLGFLIFNFYPASVFPGDTGTLTLGASLAVGAMLSKLEFAGAVMFLPIILEFFIKARNGFPSTGWGGDLKDGILYCPPRRPVGLGQLLLKATGGLHERNLVLLFYALQAILCATVVLCYVAVA